MEGYKTFLEVGTACSDYSFSLLGLEKELSKNNPLIVIHANFPPHGSGDPFAFSKDRKSLS